MSLFAWNRIDAALGWPILWVTVAWCALTGLSQHTLARLSLLASLVGAIVGELAGWYGDTLWLEIAFLAYYPLIVVWVLWIAVPSWERWSDSLEGTDILPTELLMFRWFRWMRPLGVILTLVQWDRPRQFAIDLAWYVGFYALTVYGPRKPALWRRAVDPLNRIAARVVGVDLRHLSLAPLK